MRFTLDIQAKTVDITTDFYYNEPDQKKGDKNMEGITFETDLAQEYFEKYIEELLEQSASYSEGFQVEIYLPELEELLLEEDINCECYLGDDDDPQNITHLMITLPNGEGRLHLWGSSDYDELYVEIPT